MTVKEYILENWQNTVKYNPKDEETLIGLPYPYTTPCMENTFQEMYYWDTYFINRGLLASGRIVDAKNNLKNFIYLIRRFGFIPNGTRTYYLCRSQPPFFGLMLKDVLAVEEDEELKKEGYKALVKEMEFWETQRKSVNGLNIYSCDVAKEIPYKEYISYYTGRTGIVPPASKEEAWVFNAYCECESGWDFNPRFYGKCHDYNPICLNSLLWFNEAYLSKLEVELGLGDGKVWAKKAKERKKRILVLMRDEKGVFYDYSYAEDALSEIKSCAAFYPYFVGMIHCEQSQADELLNSLELDYGVQSTSSNYELGSYQWGKINGWACLQLVVVEALEKSGLRQDGDRIRGKFLSLVESVFEKTGRLWEKYNVAMGDAEAVSEYGTPEMMGWTAGVYMALCKE